MSQWPKAPGNLPPPDRIELVDSGTLLASSDSLQLRAAQTDQPNCGVCLLCNCGRHDLSRNDELQAIGKKSD